MNALKRRNPLTESFLVQLDVDLEALAIRIPKLKAAFPRSTDSVSNTFSTSWARGALSPTLRACAAISTAELHLINLCSYSLDQSFQPLVQKLCGIVKIQTESAVSWRIEMSVTS